MPPTGEDYLDYEKKSRYNSGANSKKDKNGKPKNGKPKNGNDKKPKNGNDKKPKNGNGNERNKTDDKRDKKARKAQAGKLASSLANALRQDTHYTRIYD